MWQQHRGDLSSETADQFEAAMYVDDVARAHYLTGAEVRQRLVAAQGQVRSAEARQQTAKTRHDDLEARRDRLTERCARIAIALGLETDAPPSAFGARLQALTTAAEADADLSNAERALKDRLTRQDVARQALTNASLPLGLGSAPDDLPRQVQRALTLEESDRRAWAKWQDGKKAIAELTGKAEQCRAASEWAEGRLDQLTAALPLPDRSLAAIRRALPHLRNLRGIQVEYQKLSRRIEALEQASAALEDGAWRLARIMNDPEDAPDADPILLIDRARARVTGSAAAACRACVGDVGCGNSDNADTG